MFAGDEYYLNSIEAFAQRHGLEKSSDLSGVETDAWDAVDLLYRFPDGAPALGFREILPGELYGNTYYHERLEDIFMFEMAKRDHDHPHPFSPVALSDLQILLHGAGAGASDQRISSSGELYTLCGAHSHHDNPDARVLAKPVWGLQRHQLH